MFKVGLLEHVPKQNHLRQWIMEMLRNVNQINLFMTFAAIVFDHNFTCFMLRHTPDLHPAIIIPAWFVSCGFIKTRNKKRKILAFRY